MQTVAQVAKQLGIKRNAVYCRMRVRGIVPALRGWLDAEQVKAISVPLARK